MRHMMDSLLDSRTFPEFTTELEPAVNLYEKDGTYTLECAVPGSYSQEKTEDKNQYHRREIQRGSFTRTVSLPQEVDPEQVAAKLENGMLKITLHPTKAIKSKNIPVTG